MYKDEANLRNCRNVTWNEHGSGLMFEDFNIPIVKLQNGSDVDFIKKVSSFFVCFFQTLHCILSKLTNEWESFIYKPYKCWIMNLYNYVYSMCVVEFSIVL